MKNVKPIFDSKITPDGNVKLSLFKRNGKTVSVTISPEAVTLIAAQMLQNAALASSGSKAEENDNDLQGAPVLNPTGIGLSLPDERFPVALVAHMGRARLGISISKPHELLQALTTLLQHDKNPQ